MRAFSLFLAVTLLAAAVAVLTNQDQPTGPGIEEEGPSRRAENRPEAVSGWPEPSVGLPAAPAVSMTSEGAGAERMTTILPEQTRPFRGIVMTQKEGERPFQAKSGRLELDLLDRSGRTPFELELVAGGFSYDVPMRARLVLKGGVVNGDRVRFDAPRGPFDPIDGEYALVAIPLPLIELLVREATQEVPLAGITVSRAEDATTCWMGDETPAWTALVEDQASPVALPDLDVKHPVWLRVDSQGYAGSHVMVDPRQAGTKEVRLYPPAELDVRVSGPGLERLRLLVLGRIESEERRPHVGTLDIHDKGVDRGPNGTLFPIRGLAAMRHVIVAKGIDRQGRTVDLAEIEVDLEPNVRSTAELRLP